MGCIASQEPDSILEIKIKRRTREGKSPRVSAMRSRAGSMVESIPSAKRVSFEAKKVTFDQSHMGKKRSSKPDLETCDFHSFRFTVENFPKAFVKKVELKRLRDFGHAL